MSRSAALRFSCLLSLLISGVGGCAQEAETRQPNPDSFPALTQNLAKAQQALDAGKRAKAAPFAEQVAQHVAEYSIQDPQVALRAADVLLRSGKYRESVPLFDQFIEARPYMMPQLWQRGIALYFAGEYALGAEQFEKHRLVNANDVENAAWHFVCLAKAESFDQAVASILPAPNDPRIPMNEVLEMLSTGNTELVTKRVGEIPENSRRRAMARFYGDFYLGLYADAKGEQEKALDFLQRSAQNAPPGYMGDIAHVYVEYLTSPQNPK